MLTRILKAQRGFTLIELMAVIAIMTVLAGLVAGAVTGIGATGQSARLVGDANTVGTAADRFFNDAFPQSYPVLSTEVKCPTTPTLATSANATSVCTSPTPLNVRVSPADLTTSMTPAQLAVALTGTDLGVRLIDFEAVLPGDPKRAFVPDFIKEVPATAGQVSWRVVTATGEVFFAEDGAQLVRPSSNRLDISAANSTASTSATRIRSGYNYKLRMKKNEAALEVLKIEIPAGYSIGGQSVAKDVVMGLLTGNILTDNPWSAGQDLPVSGVLTATGTSNEWLLSVDYPDAVTDISTTAKAAIARADRTGATRHKVSLTAPSLEAAGSINIVLNTTGDKAHNQATEEWTLTICGIANAAGSTSCGTTSSDTNNLITNPEIKAVYRWLAKEQTSIDVAGTFDTVAGNQSVVIK